MEFVVTRRNQSGSRGAGSSLETEDIGYNGMPFIRWAELAEWSNPGDTEEVEAGLPKPETLKIGHQSGERNIVRRGRCVAIIYIGDFTLTQF